MADFRKRKAFVKFCNRFACFTFKHLNSGNIDVKTEVFLYFCTICW